MHIDPITSVFWLAILIMSVVVHEFSHGWMAYQLGDTTAKDFGRLTLNPIRHLDFFGSFLVPLAIFVFSGGQAIFGWAKPVPFNPYNLTDQRYGEAKVAFAGPGANLAVALFFGLLLRFTPDNLLISLPGLVQIFSLIILLNIILAIFNLVPIPPLDGSKILFTFLPASLGGVRSFLEQYGIIVLLFFIFFAFQWILPIVFSIFELFVGQSLMF